MTSTRVLCGALVGSVMVTTVAVAGPEAWPIRAIRVISPFAAGSASDNVGRVVLDRVSQQIGQPIVVESRPGAGGTIGTADVAKANPDGYTLLVSSSSLGSQLVLHKELSYDPARDLVPVSLIGVQPTVLITSSRSGYKSIADLVAAAKAKPGALTFASAGVGSSSHLAAERFRLAANIDVRHIPYREGGIPDLMAGRIDFYCIPLAAGAAPIASGKVVPLAVSTPQRAALLPNVPTMAQAGYPGAEFLFWIGLSAPAHTAPEIVQQLHEQTMAALQVAAVRDRLAKLGVELDPMTTAQFDDFVRKDLAATVQLAKAAHIQATE
jgi:tripartite-type tricarboxylate transporter receptor subunit TctC